jgi:hypothetical protein
MSEENDFQQTKDAWDRLARTPDGLVIYRHLQRIRQALATDMSALPAFEGRRSLAADLMAFMSDGIRDYDRACVTYTIAKPERTERTTRGAGRRITPDTFVAGYDLDRTGTPYDAGGLVAVTIFRSGRVPRLLRRARRVPRRRPGAALDAAELAERLQGRAAGRFQSARRRDIPIQRQ